MGTVRREGRKDEEREGGREEGSRPPTCWKLLNQSWPPEVSTVPADPLTYWLGSCLSCHWAPGSPLWRASPTFKDSLQGPQLLPLRAPSPLLRQNFLPYQNILSRPTATGGKPSTPLPRATPRQTKELRSSTAQFRAWFHEASGSPESDNSLLAHKVIQFKYRTNIPRGPEGSDCKHTLSASACSGKTKVLQAGREAKAPGGDTANVKCETCSDRFLQPHHAFISFQYSEHLGTWPEISSKVSCHGTKIGGKIPRALSSKGNVVGFHGKVSERRGGGGRGTREGILEQGKAEEGSGGGERRGGEGSSFLLI